MSRFKLFVVLFVLLLAVPCSAKNLEHIVDYVDLNFGDTESSIFLDTDSIRLSELGTGKNSGFVFRVFDMKSREERQKFMHSLISSRATDYFGMLYYGNWAYDVCIYEMAPYRKALRLITIEHYSDTDKLIKSYRVKNAVFEPAKSYSHGRDIYNFVLKYISGKVPYYQTLPWYDYESDSYKDAVIKPE